MNTIREYTSDGVQVLYPVDFDLGYIRRQYVYVYSSDDNNDYETQLSYTWINNTQIELTDPLDLGEVLKIRRVVPRTELVNNYEDGAILNGNNLDNSYLQLIMVFQEIEDGFYQALGETVLQQAIDMSGNQIRNLGGATEPTDAITLGQVETLLATIAGDPDAVNAILNGLDDEADARIAGDIALAAADGGLANAISAESTARNVAVQEVWDNSVRVAGVVTGTTDALVATVTPTLTALYNGLTIVLTPVATNTTTTPTLTIGGATKTIIAQTGLPVAVGALLANAPTLLRYNGTTWVLLFNNTQPVRRVVSAAQTFATDNTTYTFTHNLGVLPIVQFMGRCLTAHGNYAIGEEVVLASFRNTDQLGSGDNAHGVSVYATSSSVIAHIRVLRSFHIGDSVVGSVLDLNKWELYTICMG